jgi:hypothetical protein
MADRLLDFRGTLVLVTGGSTANEREEEPL